MDFRRIAEVFAYVQRFWHKFCEQKRDIFFAELQSTQICRMQGNGKFETSQANCRKYHCNCQPADNSVFHSRVALFWQTYRLTLVYTNDDFVIASCTYHRNHTGLYTFVYTHIYGIYVAIFTMIFTSRNTIANHIFRL